MSTSPIQSVTPSEAEILSRGSQHIFVDVRSVQEFEQGHPPGAYNVPILFRGPDLYGYNPDFVPAMQRHFALDAALVFV